MLLTTSVVHTGAAQWLPHARLALVITRSHCIYATAAGRFQHVDGSILPCVRLVYGAWRQEASSFPSAVFQASWPWLWMLLCWVLWDWGPCWCMFKARRYGLCLAWCSLMSMTLMMTRSVQALLASSFERRHVCLVNFHGLLPSHRRQQVTVPWHNSFFQGFPAGTPGT